MSDEFRRLRFYLVRHGLTDWNREGRMQGHTDVPLNAEGQHQANCIAKRIAALPEPPCAIWSSDLSRAADTAGAIAASLHLEVVHTSDLRETMLGEWEGLTTAEIIARGDEERLDLYRRDSYRFRPPGGEKLDAVWARMMSVQDAMRQQYRAGAVVIVAHGSCLRVPVCAALEAPVASMQRFWMDNAALSIVEERDQYGLRYTSLTLLNDTSHLTSV